MGSINKVILIGRLGADPELRDAGGSQVCCLRIATSENWTDRDGERREMTEWHDVSVWGKQAESCARFLQKGREVCIEGQLTSREATNREGSTVRYWSIKARSVTFLGSMRDEQGANQANQGNQGGNQGGGRPQQQSKPQRNDWGGGHSDPIPF